MEQGEGPLSAVDPAALEGDARRTAFWINVYNALVTQALEERPARGSILLQLRLFERTGYVIGGETYTPNVIEHGLLRGNRRPPWHLRPALRAGDARLLAAPAEFDPRIHFALNCGARSCPPIRRYESGKLDAQLELATRSYLSQESRVEPGRRSVALPGLLRLYRADFGSKADALRFAAAHVPRIQACLREPEGAKVSYLRFDWSAAGSATGQMN